MDIWQKNHFCCIVEDKLEGRIRMDEGRPVKGQLQWLRGELTEVVVEREGSREVQGSSRRWNQ